MQKSVPRISSNLRPPIPIILIILNHILNTFFWRVFDAIMRLATPEFIRRFLIHVLPERFHRIRHYGLLASGGRKTNLTKIRALLCVQPQGQADVHVQDTEPDVTPLTLREPCPCCGGPMRIIEIFRRGQKPMSRAPPREQAA